MAGCSGHVACLVYGCDGTHRASCSNNKVVLIPNVAVGNVIKASDIEALRANTIAEINRWNLHVNYNFSKRSTTAFVSGEIIDDAKTNKLIQDLSTTGHGSTANVSVGTIVSASKIANNILGLYNSLRTDCICNSYMHQYTACSCNGNYCSGCNGYSDERLKTNIKEL